ncbi:TetR/AcrR family transcriptional regulator [Undibacterium terreum]|uniref:TetR family transcriptional regulator n=1 Tax=Undibacterium terreum TaxID=1224302 RepID=A0A916UV40_9BURK|nr:TetR/AcrR family transcriptional regulator [Undibacterium terreum]GGC89146.1 TetR family transcriptional regulator [Undibacterium terreum]
MMKSRRDNLGVRSEKRVQEILAAARVLFASEGYEKTTTLDIAQHLGISEATVFTYFGSKRDLCIEVIKLWYAEITAVLQAEIPLFTGTRNKLRFAINKHLHTLLKEERGLCALILSEGRNTDAEFAGIIADLKRLYVAPVMQLLAQGRDSGELRQDIPLKLMRDMVYGPMEHILWERILSNQTPDIAATTEQLTEMLWAAFAAPRPALDKLTQFRADVITALSVFE